MKIFRPGLPAVFTDEDAINQPPPPKVVKAGTNATAFLTPEEAIRAAQLRHQMSMPAAPVATAQVGSLSTAQISNLTTAQVASLNTAPTQTAPSPNPGASGAPHTTEIIPPVAPQPLIDNNKPAVTTQPEPEVNTSPELTPEEEAELDALLAKRDHTHQEPHTP
jgi:hypothetical protein